MISHFTQYGLILAFCLPLWPVGDSFQIVAISNRPERISGGDVLVRITAPEEIGRLTLNGKEITSVLQRNGTPHSFLGLVTGLDAGQNSLAVFRKDDETAAAQLTVVNHPLSGPVFSGPHEQPFICQTADFKLPDGQLLGEPLDAACSARTVVTYLYRAAESEPGEALKPLTNRASLPSDVAMTTTTTGDTVPYVVRIETGTINRAIYQIAVLHDPTSQSEPDAFQSWKGWNRRLLYSFGGGCTGGWYKQGTTTGLSLNTSGPGTLTDAVLGKGYAYVSSTLNVFGNNCQDVTAAETMMMVKEHFIETYGQPLFTFGCGGSGGAYQQVQIADNYPGLLDGIIPSATFPDVLATIQFLADAQLLDAYYARIGDALTDEQKRAVAGVGVLRSVTRISSGAGRINPRVFCPPELPVALRYDPVANPSGVRCDVYDHTVNVYGRDPATGFARRPLDNTGVQYGLTALNDGVITPTQFLDLNEAVGGHDNDGNIVPTRSVADPSALQAAYSTGRVANGGGGLAALPIIDLRGYLDLNAGGDIHQKYHSFSFRERLLRANGTTANQVMVVSHPATKGLEEYTIAKMDEWLTNLLANPSGFSTMERIVKAKPADLVDQCHSPTAGRIEEPQMFTGGECNRLYPTFLAPRMVAGGPVTNDVLKCQLKAVDFSDYKVAFTAREKRRLTGVFSGGVCDWSKTGIAQQKLSGTWISY